MLLQLVMFANFRRWLAKARDQATDQSFESSVWQAALQVVPGSVIIWPSSFPEQEYVSKNLGAILNLPESVVRSVGYADVLNGFEGLAREELESSVEGLRRNGMGFSLNVYAASAGKTMEMVGKRVMFEQKKNGHVDVLWLRDRSAEAEELAQLQGAHEGLAAAQQGLFDLLDQLPQPIWMRDKDLNITYCNAAYRNAVEGDPVADVDQNLELAAGVVGDHGKALARQALEESKVCSEQHRIVVGGKRQVLRLTEMPLKDRAGVGGFAFDRTEVEDLETAVSRHDEETRELLETVRSAIVVFSGEQKLKFFNNEFVDLFEFEETWLNTRPSFSQLLESLREKRKLPETANFPMFKAEWIGFFTELDIKEQMLYLPDGSTLRMVVAPYPLGGLLFMFEDVSERLALEASHNTLQAVQQETLDNMHESIAVFGSDGKLRLSNPAFARLWHLSENDLRDAPHISDVVDKIGGFLKQQSHWKEIRSALIRPLSDRTTESGQLARDDDVVLSYSIVPLPDGAALYTFLDVTDRAVVENALRDRAQALEAADQLKSEFIANVSYGLRAPLTSVIGFAEILSDEYFGKMNKKQQEYTQGIVQSSQELMDMINDVIDLATIEAGYMELHFENVDVYKLSDHIRNLVAGRADDEKISFAVTCPENIGTCRADEIRLKQTLLNLLSNSLKYTPEGGSVKLTISKVDDHVQFMVKDTGVGIAEEDQRRVFEKFERAHEGVGRPSGTGLGLSLVKNLVELHGGSVSLSSQPGEGTIVTCLLPIDQQDEQPKTSMPLVDEVAQTKAG